MSLPLKIKTALVHYWLVNRRGGESVLEAIGRLHPNADLITHVADPDMLFGSLAGMPLTTTFINGLPAARKIYPLYLPLMPMALEAIDVNDYELIISSEAGPAKWVLPAPGATHICYCHSPMRYIWDQRAIYMSKVPGLLRPIADLAAHGLRQSDVLSSMRVTHFVANSAFVAKRIAQFYRRDAEVIHPLIDLEDFAAGEAEDFYLVAGQVVDYKRVDLAVQACARLGRRLIVAGGGNTRALAQRAGPHTEFLGRVDTATLRDLMKRCRALLFPGIEDFGIVPIEVMASGRPVIAFGAGGALETVEPGVSGLLFERQTVEAVCDAILEFERSESRLTPETCRQSAARFSRAIFEARFKALVERALRG